MGMAPLRFFEMAILVVLKGDNHHCSIRVSDCSIMNFATSGEANGTRL